MADGRWQKVDRRQIADGVVWYPCLQVGIGFQVGRRSTVELTRIHKGMNFSIVLTLCPLPPLLRTSLSTETAKSRVRAALCLR